MFPSEFWKLCKHTLLALLGSAILSSSFTQTSNTELYKIGNYIKYVNIPIALFIMLVEYLRGAKKRRSRADERLFQSYIAPILDFFRFLTRNYFLCSIVYILLSGPSKFSLATTMVGFMLFMSGFFYFITACTKKV